MLEHNNFKQELTTEMKELEELKIRLQKELSTAPEGSLNVLQKRNRTQPDFYWYKGRENRKYLARKAMDLVKKLAQKEYNMKLLKVIEHRLEYGCGLLEEYETPLEQVYLNIGKGKQNLISPIQLSDEEYIQLWHEKHPGTQNKYPIIDSFYTDKGEHVRSKSEKIIADLFQKYNIPYVYEPLIYFKNGNFVCPDFMVLNVRLRKTIVYEHFGRMGDQGYGERTCKKMDDYEQNGFWPGDNFLFSMESQQEPLNMRIVESIIKRFLI